MRISVFLLLSLLSFYGYSTPLFPSAVVFENSRIAEARFNLAIGGMEKQNGVWQPEKTLKVAIEGERQTHEIGYSASVHEAFEFYSNEYKSFVVQQLFSCEGLDCGSSAQWANGYFGVRELYGPDKEQRLAVWLLDTKGQQEIVTLYVIQRGNKKVYAHIDAFSLTQPLAVDMPRSQLIDTVYNIDKMRTDALRDLAKTIRAIQSEDKNVWLVGHAYGSTEQSENMIASKELAQALAEKLSMLGVVDLNIDAVGMLSPLGGTSADRVAVLAVVN